MSIGELIKQYREKMGLSQREFANKCGISNVSISQYEKNGINPKTGKPFKIEFVTYLKLAQAMEMDIDDMFEIRNSRKTVTLIEGSKKASPKRDARFIQSLCFVQNVVGRICLFDFGQTCQC